MTELDEVLPDEAFALIDEFGKSVSYKEIQDGVYNRDTGKTETAVPSEAYFVKAIVEDIKGKRLGGNLIEECDKKLFVAALSFTNDPTPLDEFTFDGDTFLIDEAGLKAIYSGELIALYELKIKK